SFPVTAGTTYSVAVDGFEGESGTVQLSHGPPTNDGFGSAIEFSLSGSSPVSGSSLAATKEAGEPAHAGEAGGASVWWRFTPTSSGLVSLSTEGSDFDPLLAVYTGGSVWSLTEVASSDDTAGTPRSRVSFPVTAGTTYSVAVDGRAADTGAIQLHILNGVPP